VEGSGDKAASCVADDATPGTDGGTKDAGAGGTGDSGSKRDAGDEPEEPEEKAAASCSCTVGPGATRSHSGPSGYGAGLLLVLAATLLTRRRSRG
jgi:hypothetical protein